MAGSPVGAKNSVGVCALIGSASKVSPRRTPKMGPQAWRNEVVFSLCIVTRNLCLPVAAP